MGTPPNKSFQRATKAGILLSLAGAIVLAGEWYVIRVPLVAPEVKRYVLCSVWPQPTWVK